MRTRIGMVFQDPAIALDPRRTAGDSIAGPIVLHARGTEHPYTRRLLDAAPVPDPRRQRARQASAS